ncbi:response regulator [Aurantiacibacter suaedae]|uniref:hybrid sensor histidine kinase/response regulator n=1 Tax=Aurantiacibacter suaedae TaxID=2545755 RepID=UPI0010F94248|nr:response regulator [Aurantiacibacter suaedae]
MPLVALGFACGLAAMMMAAAMAVRGQRPAADVQEALPDWSVTLAAIESTGHAAQGKARAAIAITDRANRLVCANPAFEEAFGSLHAPPRMALDAGGSDRLSTMVREAWREGEAATCEVAGDGHHWRVHTRRAGRADEYMIWSFTPIEEVDMLADMAMWLRGPFGAMFGDAGLCLALVGPEGTILAANSELAARACGDGSATLAGQEFAELLRSDDRDRIHFTREGRKGSPQTLWQVPLAPPEAEPASLMLLVDAGMGLGGTAGDAKGQAGQLEALLEQLPLGLAMTDRDGRFLFANPAFRRAAGLEAHSLPPYPSDLVIARDKTAMSDAVRRYAQGPASSGDIAVRLSVEPDEPASLGLAGVRGMGEAAVLLSLADTTEETRLRRQVAQATKMQAVGQLAGGVAHDFNNVLTAIIGYCDLMLLRHTPGDSDYDDIQQIKANSNRAASLTRQLLAFSRQQTLQSEVLQLPDVMSEVTQMLKRLLGAKITLDVRHDRNLGAVRADPRQLEQVIINLAVNARDAIQTSGGGEGASGILTFTTRRVEARDIRRMGSDIIPAGEYTALICEDTGGGIAPAIIGKIFEPFFTTKDLGKGTGLGLSTVYGIVKQSGGFIFASNVQGITGRPAGARFTIYLPVHEASEEELKKTEAVEEARNWAGGGRILLVEDEDMVRAVAERALTRQGYEVITASDGDEGFELVRGGEQFDLVVSDVVMPVMDGPAMALAIREVAPDLPILFMSGYAEAQLRDQIDIVAMHFIPKPFSVQQIADKVAEVLTASSRRD